MLNDSTRPVVHCLVARHLGDGKFTRSQRVTLGASFTYKEAGFWVVGPDPEDWAALAEWERSRQTP